MTFTIVSLSAAYALVVALLAYLLLLSRLHWVFKVLATVATVALIPLTFYGIGELRGVADQIGRRHCGGVDVGRDGNLLRQPHTGGGERIKIEQNPVLHSPAGYASNAPSPPPFRPLHCVHHLRQQCCRIANTGRGSDICPSPALPST